MFENIESHYNKQTGSTFWVLRDDTVGVPTQDIFGKFKPVGYMIELCQYDEAGDGYFTIEGSMLFVAGRYKYHFYTDTDGENE